MGLNVLLVVHEASRTGAPKVGGLLASALKSDFSVRLLCLKDGPLRAWLESRTGTDSFQIFDRGIIHLTSFETRVENARQYLQYDKSNIVYVNSLAASEFVVAAKMTGKKVILHVHEKLDEMRSLLRHQLIKFNILSLCDAVILAGDDIEGDLRKMFGRLPSKVLSWGIAVDTREIWSQASENNAFAHRLDGQALVWDEKILIGMVGHASRRKGADIFLETAAVLPQHNFIWVGNWTETDAPENKDVYERHIAGQYSNIFMTGGVENPYKYMRRFDLFFLSSREDPNPLVLAEAMLLTIPIFCFSNTTAVADFLGRSAILHYGQPNVSDAVRTIRNLSKDDLRSGRLCPPAELVRDRFDLGLKSPQIAELLRSLVS